MYLRKNTWDQDMPELSNILMYYFRFNLNCQEIVTKNSYWDKKFLTLTFVLENNLTKLIKINK